MIRYYLTAIFVLLVGCDRQLARPLESQPRSLPAIQKIVAAQLKRSVAEIRGDSTFASLGADDLDLVEIVMATEEALNISINDDALTKAAGVTKPDKAVGSLTIQSFATLADASPTQSHQPNTEPNHGGLRVTQVGQFGELSKLPNPRGHELVFLPSLEELTIMSETKLGRKLTSDEQADLKARAVVIVMTREDSAKLREQRLERQNSK